MASAMSPPGIMAAPSAANIRKEFLKPNTLEESIDHLVDNVLPMAPHALDRPPDAKGKPTKTPHYPWEGNAYSKAPIFENDEDMQESQYVSLMLENRGFLNFNGKHQEWLAPSSASSPDSMPFDPRSRTTTPQSDADAGKQRKKISLKDYKNRGGMTVKENKEPKNKEDDWPFVTITPREPEKPLQNGQASSAPSPKPTQAVQQSKTEPKIVAEKPARIPPPPPGPPPRQLPAPAPSRAPQPIQSAHASVVSSQSSRPRPPPPTQSRDILKPNTALPAKPTWLTGGIRSQPNNIRTQKMPGPPPPPPGGPGRQGSGAFVRDNHRQDSHRNPQTQNSHGTYGHNPYNTHSLSRSVTPEPRSQPDLYRRDNLGHSRSSSDSLSKPSPHLSQQVSRTSSGISQQDAEQVKKKREEPEVKVSPSKALPQAKTDSPKKSFDLPVPLSPLTSRSTPNPRPGFEPGSAKKAKTERPVSLDLPRPLSPLPGHLASPHPGSQTGSVNKADATPPKSPKRKADEISNGPSKTASVTQPKSPLSVPSPVRKHLPPNLERELQRIKDARKVNSVAGRYERSRNPDVPGVARKMPKKTAAERRRRESASEGPEDHDAAERHSLIIKLKFKRRLKDVQRILRIRPMPDRKLLPSNGVAVPSPLSTATFPTQTKSSDKKVEDKKLEVKKPEEKRSPDKKRPRSDEVSVESAAKRAKVPSRLDSDKLTTSTLQPPFKSPATSGPPPQKLLSTPKKGDSMKSVALQRVHSNDGNARTPQAASTPASMSTPASAEKPRQNGNSDGRSSELDAQIYMNNKLTKIGTQLKRKRDELLNKPDMDRELCCVVGIESLIAYIAGFHALDNARRLNPRQSYGDIWSTFFPLHKAIVESATSFPQLYILTLLFGAITADAQNNVYMDKLAVDAIATNPQEMSRLRHDMITNHKRCTYFWEQYRNACRKFATRNPQDVRGKMSFIKGHGGPAMPIAELKIVAIDVLKEYIESKKVDWKVTLDF